MCMSDAKVTQPLEQEHVAAAIGYNSFIGRVCCMHSYIPKPFEMSREFIIECFHYPFEVCNVVEILGTVDNSNEAAKKLNYRLGFTDRTVIKNGAFNSDLIIMGLRKEDSKWLNKRRR